MKPLPKTPPWLAVARRVVWFEEPETTLDKPIHFLAHVMTYGTIEDLQVVMEELTLADFGEALDKAPAGIIDGRSWAYWRLRCGRDPSPLPKRYLGP